MSKSRPAATVVASQRVDEYPPEKLRAYLLDGGRRPELRSAAEELDAPGVLCHPFIYFKLAAAAVVRSGGAVPAVKGRRDTPAPPRHRATFCCG